MNDKHRKQLRTENSKMTCSGKQELFTIIANCINWLKRLQTLQNNVLVIDKTK